jgi:arylsulfatase A-like enzyme
MVFWQVVSACKDAELYESTLVIFLSDHGEMNMEHRQVCIFPHRMLRSLKQKPRDRVQSTHLLP